MSVGGSLHGAILDLYILIFGFVPCWIFGFVRSQVATVSPVPYWITTASQPPVTDSGTAGSSENHRLQCSLQTAQPQSTLSQLLTMMFCTSTVAHDHRELLVFVFVCVFVFPCTLFCTVRCVIDGILRTRQVVAIRLPFTRHRPCHYCN